jgi:hypothetical protein
LSGVTLISAILMASLSLARVARAEADFPAAFREAAGLRCIPQCTLCHVSPAGGLSFNPFGVNVFANGVIKGDPSSLVEVVAALRTKAVDSDTDGVNDVDEFENGGDPSKPNVELGCPTYGCGARIAEPNAQMSNSTPSVILALSALGLAIVRAASVARRVRRSTALSRASSFVARRDTPL